MNGNVNYHYNTKPAYLEQNYPKKANKKLTLKYKDLVTRWKGQSSHNDAEMLFMHKILSFLYWNIFVMDLYWSFEAVDICERLCFISESFRSTTRQTPKITLLTLQLF